MTQVIRFATFNVGNGATYFKDSQQFDGDYIRAMRRDPVNGIQAWEDALAKRAEQLAQGRGEERGFEIDNGAMKESAGRELYDDIERQTAEKLAQEADVIALQEVYDPSNRWFIVELKSLGFEILCPLVSELQGKTSGTSKVVDCVIAVRKGVFAELEPEAVVSNVKNLSMQSKCSKKQGSEGKEIEMRDPTDDAIYGRDIAVIKGTLACGVEAAFTSLHSLGMSLFPKGVSEECRQRGQSTEELTYQNFSLAYTKEACERVLNGEGRPAQIVLGGGDFNNNLHNYLPQFKILTDAGYRVSEPKEYTHYNPANKDIQIGSNQVVDYKDQVVDLIYSRSANSNILMRVMKAFVAFIIPIQRIYISEAQVIPGFEFEHGKNCSDHKPVRAVITICHESTLGWMLRGIWSNTIGRLFASSTPVGGKGKST